MARAGERDAPSPWLNSSKNTESPGLVQSDGRAHRQHGQRRLAGEAVGERCGVGEADDAPLVQRNRNGDRPAMAGRVGGGQEQGIVGHGIRPRLVVPGRLVLCCVLRGRVGRDGVARRAGHGKPFGQGMASAPDRAVVEFRIRRRARCLRGVAVFPERAPHQPEGVQKGRRGMRGVDEGASAPHPLQQLVDLARARTPQRLQHHQGPAQGLGVDERRHPDRGGRSQARDRAVQPRHPVGRGAQRAPADVSSGGARGAQRERRQREEQRDDRDPGQNSPSGAGGSGRRRPPVSPRGRPDPRPGPFRSHLPGSRVTSHPACPASCSRPR